MDKILQFITYLLSEATSYIDKISGGNQFMAGFIAVGLGGILTYFTKSLPLSFYNFILKHITTELSVINEDQVFYNLLEWINDKGYSKKFRNIKYNSGRSGYELNSKKSVGYGSHIFWYDWHPIKITFTKDNRAGSDKITEFLTFKKLGRSHKIFEKIIEESNKINEKKNKISVCKYVSYCWQTLCSIPYKNLDNIVLDKNIKEKLNEAIINFKNSENWYLEKGIPYQLGILLYGPPGTGKTSIIKAIASKFKQDIYIVQSLMSIDAAIGCMKDDAILVIEDIDSSTISHSRKENSNKNNEKNDDVTMSLSQLLNTLDGIGAKHGRILIATTNHIEKLDPALIRPGRIDLKLEIGYFTPEMFVEYLKKFYQNVPNITKIKDGVTGAILQQDILNKLSLEEIVEKYEILSK